ncbi:CHAD domain-containing protein [Mycobacterium vicinigordonae]|uniref:CHAD domain-containing protein n=1 Tax=Mycobacterium vicinigordonae TaxID=1719132 RepID=A0A7D6HTI7_9MYCO|nr:CHAD domain-containing protein [Mycobacterium vicinigordonae]QLL07052.1 CHAD domain-containing protein [Mycobacterium vicinigordonae]
MPGRAATNALVGYLNTQIDRIVAGEVGLRGGADPIHDTRVAIRRLRSTLRVFRPDLDSSAIGGLDLDLKWFAGLLGEVRDCQVQLRRFDQAVEELPDVLVLGPVKSRIRNDLKAIELPARARVSEEMDSERYLNLMTALLDLRTTPRVVHAITGKRLRKRVERAGRKADRRLTVALYDGSDEMLHRARKAAKRARYAGELCKPVHSGSRRIIKKYKGIQTLLGDHQDAVVACDVLRRMAVTAGTTQGENGFTYGLLHAREQQIALRSRTAVRRL